MHILKIQLDKSHTLEIGNELLKFNCKLRLVDKPEMYDYNLSTYLMSVYSVFLYKRKEVFIGWSVYRDELIRDVSR